LLAEVKFTLPGKEFFHMQDPETYSLSTETLNLILRVQDGHLCLHQFCLAAHPGLCLLPSSELFRVMVDGRLYSTRNLALLNADCQVHSPGLTHFQACLGGPGFEVDLHLAVYDGNALLEIWPVVRCIGPRTCQITRADSYCFDLPAGEAQLFSFRSDWGQEFEPEVRPLDQAILLETQYGRSSKGMHPWYALRQADRGLISGAIAWSGNWAARFEPLSDGGCRIRGGLHDWNFGKSLVPMDQMECPHCMLVLGENLNAVSQQYARIGREYWYPRNALSARLPVEWNPWWSYEDVEINENVFARNLDSAAGLGMEIVTLDAGWFGPSEAGSLWHDFRGDWERVNLSRFPHGIRALADQAHAVGLRFGLWCEIEGLGRFAGLNGERPDLPAAWDGQPGGYVCFGNPAAQTWAFEVLSRLIRENDCDWIKLDFNVDPGAGCNRLDHGHGAEDGLFEHYQGYYRVLDRLRQDFPEVLFESCSSGGLRIDLGLLRHTHLTFLSDPDWPVHSLQVFWGASTMLAPNACLHWSFSQWRGSPPPQQNFDPTRPDLTPHQLDYYTRIAMLGGFGLSQKLPDLPAWVAARLAFHIRVYCEQVRAFVLEGDCYRLTAQPRRDGSGDRWCAFQYSLQVENRHLLFVFRLSGASSERPLRLPGLQAEKVYRITGFDGEAELHQSGRKLMETGLLLKEIPEEGSRLLILD
jgi:alpha-galactosidase